MISQSRSVVRGRRTTMAVMSISRTACSHTPRGHPLRGYPGSDRTLVRLAVLIVLSDCDREESTHELDARGRAAARLQALLRRARLMFLGRTALEAPRYIWWNFVWSRKERIERARRAARRAASTRCRAEQRSSRCRSARQRVTRARRISRPRLSASRRCAPKRA